MVRPGFPQNIRGFATTFDLDLRTAIVKVRGLNGVIQARSSVEEHHLDTVGVGSSILPVPTALPRCVSRWLQGVSCGRSFGDTVTAPGRRS